MFRRSFNVRGNGGGRSYIRRNQFKRPVINNRGASKIPVSQFIKKASVSIQPTDFVPKLMFSDLTIDAVLKNNILKHGFKGLTAIQEQTINHILDTRDVIGIANTGTGKTAAFLIPLLDKIKKNPATRVLIIVPTRELAQQIRDELKMFSYNMNIYASLCIGGAYIRNQMYELARRPHFVIGTPGRLKDLVERKNLRLDTFNTVVLDEVDRMLDMGFIKDIKALVSQLSRTRQSLFFAATLSPDINTLAQSFLTDPIKVSVKTQETSENVDQDIIRVQPGAQKIDILTDLLKKEDFKKVLIFGKTKHGVEKLSTKLYQKGFKVTSIHGDKPQFQRTQAIRLFKEDLVNILVATDVASRGIDIVDITHVINYDPPMTYEDYVHRIGRTGRANKKGQALTFVE